MSISKEIVLRYKSAGHVRLQIPAQLCSREVAPIISNEIALLSGVYRVNLFSNKQKLAIRFVEESLNFHELMQQLLDLLVRLENKGVFVAKHSTPIKAKLKDKLADLRGVRWAKNKYVETKETAQAFSLLTKLSLKKKPAILTNPEKTLITFFNDVLILFLVKVHWKLITKKWLLSPLKYRYQWVTVFYLMYLFIRSKFVKNK